jgi:hypothetical protein
VLFQDMSKKVQEKTYPELSGLDTNSQNRVHSGEHLSIYTSQNHTQLMPLAEERHHAADLRTAFPLGIIVLETQAFRRWKRKGIEERSISTRDVR